MGAHTKKILVRRLMAALTPAGSMPITPAQAVTRLVKLGMATGNAQRLMDPDQDVRLSTVEDVAARLRIPIGSLLEDAPSQAAPAPVDADVAITLQMLASLTPVRWAAARSMLDAMREDPAALQEAIEELSTMLRAAPRKRTGTHG